MELIPIYHVTIGWFGNESSRNQRRMGSDSKKRDNTSENDRTRSNAPSSAVSSVECIEQMRWMINALGQILSAREACRAAVTPPPPSAAPLHAMHSGAPLGHDWSRVFVTAQTLPAEWSIVQPTLRQDRPTDRLNSKVPLLLATLAPAVNDLLERRCGNYGTPWEEGHAREFPAEHWRALSLLSRTRERKRE